MYIEEFYNYKNGSNELITEAVYLNTLQSWLMHNEMSIYESLLSHFRDVEEYAICEGIHRAINKIEDVIDFRFEEAVPIDEDEEKILYTAEEHVRVSRLIFKDILTEIYDTKFSKHKEDN